MLTLKLIYSVISENNKEILYQIKKGYMDKDYPMVAFIKTYYFKNKNFPQVETVEDKFGVKLPANSEKASYWLSELKEKYKINIFDDTIRKLAKDKTNGVEHLRKAINEISGEEERTVEPYGISSADRLKRYEEKKDSGGITYLSTGDPDLDKFTYGYRKGDLWVFGGVEKSGKSFKMLRLANKADKVIHRYIPEKIILFISCEVDKEEFYGRLDCINAHIPYEDYEKGCLSEVHEDRLKNWLKKAEQRHKDGKARIVIVDDLRSLDELENYIDLYSPAIVYIDSVHLLARSLDYKDLLQMSIKLKFTARVTKVPIVISTHTKLKKHAKLKDINSQAFANFQAGRDPDFAFVLYSDEEMELRGETGMVAVATRRSKSFIAFYKTNWSTMTEQTLLIKDYLDYVSEDEDEDDSSIY